MPDDAKRPKRRETLRDVIGLGSAGAVTAGVWMIYPPAGWIVGGLLGFAWVAYDLWTAP